MKITALNPLAAAPASGDLVAIVDVSDTSMAASGSTKKIAASDLFSGVLALSGGTMTGAMTITDATANHTAFTLTDATALATAFDRASFSLTMWNPGNGTTATLRSNMTGKGLTDVTDRGVAGRFFSQDHSTVVNKTITGMARVGTTLTVTAAGHGFSNNEKVVVYGVTSTFNVSPNMTGFTATNVTTDTFDITVGGLSSGTYTSGGTVTNRPMMYGLQVGVSGRVARGGLTGTVANADDLAGITVQNESGVSSAKATDAFYLAASPLISGSAWYAAFNSDANVDYGLRIAGAITGAAVDLSNATFSGATLPGILLPNARSISAKNAAGNTDVEMIQFNSADQIAFLTTTKWADAVNIVLGTSTGSKIGTSATQKLGFFNATPIVQPASTDDLRTALINLGLYATGGASPLNLNGGTLTAAKGVFGTSAATTGVLGIPNNSSFYARNNANNADITLFRLTTSDQLQLQTTLNFTDSVNVVLGTTNGTQLGAATNQKLAFHGSTAVIQRAGAAQAAVTTTSATQTTPWGFSTQAQADAIVTLVNEIRAALVEKGLIKGAA